MDHMQSLDFPASLKFDAEKTLFHSKSSDHVNICMME